MITKHPNSLIDLTGKRFGRLIVVSRAESRNKETMWNCVCDCGVEVVVRSKDMRSGKTKSCGCYQREVCSVPPRMYGKNNPSYTHGMTGSKLYWIWAGINQRCNNPNNKSYPDYGGRGIMLCQEWKNDFQAFYDWAMANGYRDGLSVDRIDVNGNYEPSNCRWVGSVSQSNNRRNNIMITRDGETHTLSEWSRIKGLPYKVVLARYYRHGDTENLLMEVKR